MERGMGLELMNSFSSSLGIAFICGYADIFFLNKAEEVPYVPETNYREVWKNFFRVCRNRRLRNGLKNALLVTAASGFSAPLGIFFLYELGLNPLQVGVITSCCILASSTALALLSPLVDEWGVNKVMRCGLAVSLGASLIFIFPATYGILKSLSVYALGLVIGSFYFIQAACTGGVISGALMKNRCQAVAQVKTNIGSAFYITIISSAGIVTGLLGISLIGWLQENINHIEHVLGYPYHPYLVLCWGSTFLLAVALVRTFFLDQDGIMSG